MKVVYVAGPFRAANSWDMELNIRHAEALSLKLWKMGAAVICPHANTRYFQGATKDAVWLEGDLEIIRRCDAIVMTKTWRRSSGAREEHHLAKDLGMPIFHENKLQELRKWLRTKG